MVGLHRNKLLFAVAAGVTLLAGTANADFTFVLKYAFDGNYLGATFAKVTFQDIAANTVRITMSNELSGGDIDDFYFNIGPNNGSLIAGLGASHVAGNLARNTYPQFGYNAFQADGDGKFDLQFWFNNPGGTPLGAGQSSVWDISAPGLTASMFDNFSSPSGGSWGPFKVAAHFRAIPTGYYGAGGSLWITETLIPLPTAGGLALAGLLVVGGIRRRKTV